MLSLSRLLWIDSRAGLVVGALSLALSPWLARFYVLPLGVVLVVASANLLYGSYSLWLSRLRAPARHSLLVLVAANSAWALICVAAVLHYWTRASIYGLGAFLLEGLFVGALAYLEWRAITARG